MSNKIKKLVMKTSKIENQLPPLVRLKLIAKRLHKVAGVDDPQEYGNGFGQQDKTDVSSQIMEDENVQEIIEEMDDEERHVFEAAVRKAVRKVK